MTFTDLEPITQPIEYPQDYEEFMNDVSSPVFNKKAIKEMTKAAYFSIQNGLHKSTEVLLLSILDMLDKS